MNIYMVAKWVLVIGGLDWAVKGLTGMGISESLLGSAAALVQVVGYGGAAVILGYRLLTMRGKK